MTCGSYTDFLVSVGWGRAGECTMERMSSFLNKFAGPISPYMMEGLGRDDRRYIYK